MRRLWGLDLRRLWAEIGVLTGRFSCMCHFGLPHRLIIDAALCRHELLFDSPVLYHSLPALPNADHAVSAENDTGLECSATNEEQIEI